MKNNNMFNSYDSTVNGSFDTCSTYPKKCPNEKLDPCRPKIPYEDYDTEGNLIGYHWNYGDTTTLEFTIEGDVTAVDDGVYEDASDFMKDKSVSIMFYDFIRNTLVFEHDYSVEDLKENPTKVILDIDEETSKTIFVKGVYYCSFVIWDGEGLRKTLFSQTDATFTVK